MLYLPDLRKCSVCALRYSTVLNLPHLFGRRKALELELKFYCVLVMDIGTFATGQKLYNWIVLNFHRFFQLVFSTLLSDQFGQHLFTILIGKF